MFILQLAFVWDFFVGFFTVVNCCFRWCLQVVLGGAGLFWVLFFGMMVCFKVR